ncbi:MAG: substrate-binding domain-containing protein [Oscillospiraceae bacterium]
MKKILTVLMATALLASAFVGCSPKAEEESGKDQGNGGFDYTKPITVISREDGSGTRGAFIELTGVQVKNADGSKEDKTTLEAVIASKTDVMLTNVAADEYAIGYVSMGSLNENVKALTVDGVAANTDTVKDGSYKISRPFNIATKGKASEVTTDFISFIMSKQGQEVAATSGFIAIDDGAKEYTPSNLSGKIVVAGSSSVSPLMEKLIESYKKLCPNVSVELQTSDSTAGLNAVKDGICDIGMASRELKDSEKEVMQAQAIALDGIAIIASNDNPIVGLTKDDIKGIYTGEVTTWENFKK